MYRGGQATGVEHRAWKVVSELPAAALVDHRLFEAVPVDPVQLSRDHLPGPLPGQSAGGFLHVLAVYGVEVFLHLDAEREDPIRLSQQVSVQVDRVVTAARHSVLDELDLEPDQFRRPSTRAVQHTRWAGVRANKAGRKSSNTKLGCLP